MDLSHPTCYAYSSLALFSLLAILFKEADDSYVFVFWSLKDLAELADGPALSLWGEKSRE